MPCEQAAERLSSCTAKLASHSERRTQHRLIRTRLIERLAHATGVIRLQAAVHHELQLAVAQGSAALAAVRYD